MNERGRYALLVGGALAAGIIGGLIPRALSSPGQRPAADDDRRPIIQLVRQQPGLPSLADAIDSICPELAPIMPAEASATTRPQNPASVPAFVVSAGGWLMASTQSLPMGDLQAVFGPGNAAAISEVRSDPVSGLSILKSAATDLHPVTWGDQNFPRIGDFGFALQNSRGTGCSAEAAMVSSDFLTDGGAPAAYVRFDPMGPDLQPGTPVFSANGQVLGVVGTGVPTNAIVPAEMVSAILDELLRNSLSPTTKFGFRAVDYDAAVSQRLSNSRSRGAGVALVQPNTPAAKAGLQAGDIVLGVDGSPVASASELGRALDSAGQSASLDIARGDQHLTLTIGRTSTS
ncbi:MAG TPA: S1C family serine protease [Sphingomicrobium sp.]|nr:S1C family serine protease [Sphingomicrobium sp.]